MAESTGRTKAEPGRTADPKAAAGGDRGMREGSVIKETAAGAIQPPLLFLPVCQPVFPYLYFPPYFLRFLPYCLP